MSSIDNIFSEEHLLKYAGVCLDLALEIPETKAGFDTLMIPSRGAVPFFLGMVYALSKLGKISSDHESFYYSLSVQPMLADLLPENSTIKRSVERKGVRVLLAPFTADLNIEKFDGKENSEEYSHKTRDYWARFTSSFFERPFFRQRNPYFRIFTDVILKEVEKRDKIAEMYEQFPKIEKFSMIDTVISGRAANDILKSFDSLAENKRNENLSPTAFLVVDDNSKKLKSQYFVYLNRKKATGHVRIYNVPRIVSEDEGASLLGVAAVVYPSLMKASKNIRLESEEFFVGAGSWHVTNQGTYMSTFRKFMDLVYRGIDTKFSQDYGESDSLHLFERFREAREQFVKYGLETKLLAKHPGSTEGLSLNPHYRVRDIYETGSHVVHIPFDEESTEEIMRKVYKIVN